MSWRVHDYILSVIEGRHDNLDLHPAVIWKSGEPLTSGLRVPQDENAIPTSDPRAEWVELANRFLTELRNVVIRNSEYEKSIGDRVDAFIQSWPPGVDTNLLGEKLFQAVGHRDEVVVFISSRFDAGADQQREVALRLDDMLLDKFLSTLPRDGQQATRHFAFNNRNEFLKHIGRTVSRRDAPTNFVRARLNPILHGLVQMIEAQRFEFRLACEALETGICIASIGLEVAILSANVPAQLRIGMAADYIHWLGRLTRSDVADDRFSPLENLPDELRQDLAFAAQQVLGAGKALGKELDAAVQRVLNDPLVVPVFKGLLASSNQ